MEEASNNYTVLPSSEIPTDNTATFLIGFGILLIFVVVGVLASVFLCITLKKDQFLWEADRERQLAEKRASNNQEKENSLAEEVDEKTLNVLTV